MTKTLETIKNNYAQEQGYKSWSEIMFLNNRNPIAVERLMDEICVRAQKVALEKAAENACIHYPASNNLNPCVDKTTIANPENLIL